MKILNTEKYNELIKEYSHHISDEPAIFVSDYASYNEGFICGAWMSLDEFDSKEEFMQNINEFFEKLDKIAPLDFFREREEIMFQDWQCIPDEFISECSIEQDYWEYIEYINKSPDNKERIEAFYECVGYSSFGDISSFITACEDQFLCELDTSLLMSTDENLGYYLAENGYFDVPENIEPYFNYETLGNEWLQNGHEQNGYVFLN